MHVFSLPPELLADILFRLDIRSLVAYSSTCRSNYTFAASCLQSLDIGIYPSQQAITISNASEQPHPANSTMDKTTDRTNIVLPSSRSKTFYLTVHNQNKIASGVLAAYHASLRCVDLSIWELETNTALALSKASRLQHLALRMDHPHARVKHMPRTFWHGSPGSTIWNTFYAAPSTRFLPTPPASPCSSRDSSPAPHIPTAVFTELRTLHLERAGITDYQLQQIINENPKLTEIRLRKCLILTDEFFRTLSEHQQAQGIGKQRKATLKVLHFEKSNSASIDTRILKYIGQMPGIESLSLAGCSNLQNEQVIQLNEDEWKIPELTLPWPENGIEAKDIEIDPAYMD